MAITDVDPFTVKSYILGKHLPGNYYWWTVKCLRALTWYSMVQLLTLTTTVAREWLCYKVSGIVTKW